MSSKYRFVLHAGAHKLPTLLIHQKRQPGVVFTAVVAVAVPPKSTAFCKPLVLVALLHGFAPVTAVVMVLQNNMASCKCRLAKLAQLGALSFCSPGSRFP